MKTQAKKSASAGKRSSTVNPRHRTDNGTMQRAAGE